MKLPLAIAACAASTVMPAAGFAQDRQPYETPHYTPSVPAELDKDYGLPAFGPQGMGPRRETKASDTQDIPRQKPASPRAGRLDPSGNGMETPLFTTGNGRTATGRPANGYDGTETPLFTTLDRDPENNPYTSDNDPTP